MSNIAWYLKRLSVMGPAEITHRITEQLRLKQMQLKFALHGGVGPEKVVKWNQFSFCKSKLSQLPDLPWAFVCEEKVVSDRLAGNVDALGYKWKWEDTSGVWHQAPDSGRVWPRRFFGSIPYRAGNPYGDIRVAWEPSRLQHLIELALIADGGTGARADRAASLLERQFLSWCRDNPPWCGIHYISAMECGLRIVAGAYALDRMRQRLKDSEAVWTGYARMVQSHALLIEKRLSLYSSTGNHTVAESTGLVYAGLLFPELEGARRWLKTGLAILEREADRQILGDGGGIEQAFWYHLFVLDLYGVVAELLLFRHLVVPKPIEKALERGRRFLLAFANDPDDLPGLGDADGGFAVSPYLRLSWKDASVKRAGLFTFRESGYSIVRALDDAQSLLLDHGPLGMPPSYGHGHADALSVILRCGGRALLVDPGTYTYTGDPEWRAYFRGTRAHNTVCVDGCDQSLQETVFLWSRPFRAELVDAVEDNGAIMLLARHDGYEDFHVTHWRGLIINSSNNIWILDYLEGDGDHELELNWHIDARVVFANDWYFAQTDVLSRVVGIQGGQLSSSKGATAPISGWKSDKYGRKEPITTISCRYRGSLPHEFITFVGGAEEFQDIDFEPEALQEVRRWIR